MFNRSTRLLASAAASAGLAFGAVTMTAPAAQAAPAPSAGATYTCTSPLGSLPILGGLTSFDVPAQITLQNLPEVLTANVPVPAGTPLVTDLDFSATGLVPSLIFTLQSVVNTVLGNVPGTEPLVTPLNSLFTQLSNGAATITTTLGSFTPSADGLPLPIPASFEFSTLAGPLAGIGLTCTLKPGSVVPGPGGGAGTGATGVAVVKQGAKIKAKLAKKVIHPGQKAVVDVKVKTSAGQKGIGQVVAKVKGMKAKTKALKNGKVRFAFKGLAIGASKIKLRFLGNGYTNAAKKKVTVRVVR